MRLELPRLGHDVTVCPDGLTAVAALQRSTYDCLLVDLDMPGLGGIEVIVRAKELSSDTEAVVLTGKSSLETAIAALRHGAFDYLTKPCRLVELQAVLQRVAEKRELTNKYRALKQRLERLEGSSDLIGDSEAMRAVRALIAKVAPTDSTVVILGETGTGKELVARAIHYSGPRAPRPFLALNCGSVSKTLLESQLFGHVKGAFTGAVRENPGFFAAAAGGTLFLDEVTEMDGETQVRLLRAVQEREVTPVGGTRPVAVDVRIIAATNRRLREALESRVLREDLYYRLAVVVLEMPPLRERKDDIRALVEYFNSRLSKEYGLSPRAVAPEALKALEAYDWPGNVRQLENVIERAFALGCSPTIGLEDLPPEISGRSGAAAPGGPLPSGLPPPGTLGDGEREFIRRALAAAGGNKVRAAELLGINRMRLYRLLHKHRLLGHP
jgi:two-component system NtrC family response regulator